MIDNKDSFLVFRVYYENPMVINSLNLKLRKIPGFPSNVILDEMSSAKCCLLLGIFFFFIAQHEERRLYDIHTVTYCSLLFSKKHYSIVQNNNFFDGFTVETWTNNEILEVFRDEESNSRLNKGGIECVS